MKNDKLTQIWNSQKNNMPLENPEHIIKKAGKQRNKQYISIVVMSITFLILLFFTLYYAGSQWNNFMFGLVLMIASLLLRVIFEFISLYRKEAQLVTLDNFTFQKYLRKHFRLRLNVNYILTPISIAAYVFGFTKLLPYFKQGLSEAFYTYILISGFASLLVLVVIIVKGIKKESRFLRQLNNV